MKHKQKVGLFGGSFDPVHRAHHTLAAQALNQFGLDRVVWIPTFFSPFKKSVDGMASPEHRMAMVKLVCEGELPFEISPYEIEKENTSYSCETLRHFQQMDSTAQYFWVLGADALARISEWKEVDFLMQNLTFLVAGRGVELSGLPTALKMQSIRMDWNPISSTELKSGLSKGKYWEQLHPKVAEYIQEKHLYGTGK